MSTLATLNEAVERAVDTRSFNHARVQANLAYLLKRIGKYSVSIGLSLDISAVDAVQAEIEPDVCIYPKRKLNQLDDILRMSEMPLLVAEVLSPTEGVYDIVQRLKLYFTLGVQSCWLVMPATQTVTVYSTPDNFTTFSTGEAIDKVLSIQIPIEEIFE